MFEAVRDWLFDASLFDWTLRLYIAAAVGQTLFVALWAVLPWWKTSIGRALMIKSAALMIVLDWGVVNYFWGPFNHQAGIGVALFGLVVVGIFFQLFALTHAVWRDRSERRA